MHGSGMARERTKKMTPSVPFGVPSGIIGMDSEKQCRERLRETALEV
jgi:hypothetical protein